MKSALSAAAVVAIFLASSGSVLAQSGQDAMSHGAMAAPSMEATMLCRPALPGEKPSAMMGSKPLECKTMASMMLHGKMKGPKTTGMDADDADAAWQQYLHDFFQIPSSGVHIGGNR